jgi:hypothetical protein
MAAQMSEEEIYQKARKRVEEKKSFFIHLAVYIVINAMLIFIWFFTTGGEGHPWFVWALGGWGIGVIFHGLSVFLFSKDTGWERSEVEKEAERIRKSGKQ